MIEWTGLNPTSTTGVDLMAESGPGLEPADMPSTARMIDYWLGGEHHYPVDVAAAHAFEAAFGPCAHEFRTLREFLRRVVDHLQGLGIVDYLVFGAGVPTQGNVHEVAPEARVVYTDIDPANIALGQRILAGSTRAVYTYGDATDIGTIDQEVLACALPGWGRDPIGLVFLGLAAFLDDERLVRTFDDLYDAVGPGSYLAFDFDTDLLANYPEALAMMGPAFHMREPSSFPALLGRWRPSSDGIVPVARWGGKEDSVEPSAAFYGGLAVK